MAETAASLPPGITLDNTLGAFLIGVAVSVTLFGFISLQVYNYYSHYLNDPVFLKSMVGSIWLFELIHTIWLLHGLYIVVVTGFGNYGFLIDVPWTIKTSILWGGIINVIVQTFFAYRIRVLSGQWIIPVTCVCLGVIRLTSVIVSTVFTLRMTLASYVVRFQFLFVLTLVTGAVLDAVVAVSMCYWLSKNRSDIARTDRIVMRLIIFSIESGCVTFTVGLVMLITALTKGHTFTWAGVMFVLAKVYSNTLLVSLNKRKDLKSRVHHSSMNTIGMLPVFASYQTQKSATSGSESLGGSTRIEIRQDVSFTTDALNE